MPVLKVKKNGNWEELGGTSPSDGGNADTLDGKHASYFATANHTHDVDSELNSNSTNPVQNTVISNEISKLNALIGDTSVSTQINNAIDILREEIIGGEW